MNFVLSFSNCFWLIVPVLIWNMAFASRLPQSGFQNDHLVVSWVIWSEHALRFIVFGLPLILALRLNKLGLLVYFFGIVVYFSSWLPLLYAPNSSWSTGIPGILAPFITPLIIFAGISLIGHSWIYFVGASIFTGLHVWHGLKSFEIIQ